MRTPQEAYNEAILILIQRHQGAEKTIVAHKESYKLGLHVAIEQLKLSFSGVFDQIASTKEEPKEETQLPSHQQRHQEAQERGDFNPWKDTKSAPNHLGDGE